MKPNDFATMLVVVIIFAGVVYLGFQALKSSFRRVNPPQPPRPRPPVPLSTLLVTAPPEVKDAIKHFVAAVASPQTVQNATTNNLSFNAIKVAHEASKMGVTPQVYLQTKLKEQQDQLDIKKQADEAQLAISAGLELNAQKFRRQMQLIDEIGQLEKQLEGPVSNVQRQLIQKSIESKKAEYDELGRPAL